MTKILNRDTIFAGLETFFGYKAQQTIHSVVKTVSVLDVNGRVPAWLPEKTGIPMKSLKAFSELKEYPTWDEFNLMLREVEPEYLRAQLRQHEACIAMLNELYDCEHFS